MTIEKFKSLFSEDVGANGFYINKSMIVFRNPLEIYDIDSDITQSFDSLDELLDATVQNKSVRMIIEGMTDLYVTPIEGGTGKGKEGTFKFGHAADNGKDETESLFPAYANVRIKNKTLEGAMDEFHDRFKNENKEWAYEVDEQGYIHQYKSGNKSSVAISGTNKNNMILHNHPSGGAFSDSDLISASLGNEKGIVASGKNGDYIFQKKGGHFKANDFVKAVKTAKMTGTSYDDAVDKWLTANQKKYGYTYKFVKKS